MTTHHTLQTYCNIYLCYARAKENPETDFMKRMKKYWDDLYLELTDLNEKQLRQKETYAESKGLVLETNR